VAATTAVLGTVPAERSGMAASAVNTSRELGAVAGVAVLGSIVNGQLTTDLLHRLASIPGLPADLRNEVILAVTTGQVSSQSSNLPKTGPIAKIVNEIIGAAEASFGQGLDLVLLTAGSLMLAAGVIGLVLIHQ